MFDLSGYSVPPFARIVRRGGSRVNDSESTSEPVSHFAPLRPFSFPRYSLIHIDLLADAYWATLRMLGCRAGR